MATDSIPSVREMISSHTLANNIISRHANPPRDGSVLDYSELRLLRRFCENPSSKNTILEDEGMLDEPGMEAGTMAQRTRGSLAGYCIATYGVKGKEALTEGEVESLRAWFERGGAAEMD